MTERACFSCHPFVVSSVWWLHHQQWAVYHIFSIINSCHVTHQSSVCCFSSCSLFVLGWDYFHGKIFQRFFCNLKSLELHFPFLWKNCTLRWVYERAQKERNVSGRDSDDYLSSRHNKLLCILRYIVCCRQLCSHKIKWHWFAMSHVFTCWQWINGEGWENPYSAFSVTRICMIQSQIQKRVSENGTLTWFIQADYPSYFDQIGCNFLS